MAEIHLLDPHAAMPDAELRHVLVVQRFCEDDPRRTMIDMILSRGPGLDELTHPVRADGVPMTFAEALRAAKAVAVSEGIADVYGIDRTQGPREQQILAHGGDHSVGMETLEDFDTEDGETGPDMLRS